MKSKSLLSLIVALSASCVTQLQAATTLTMANWLPPSHPIVKDLMIPFAEEVTKVTNGNVKVNILKAPLGHPSAHYDFAVNGIADITFGVQNYTPGRFKTATLAELPFLSDSAEALSVAYWRTYENMLQKAGEYNQVKLLSLFTHGPGAIYSKNKPLTDIGSLTGVKLRVGGGIAHEVVQALGATPVEGPAPKSYELLSQGVANGILFPHESIAFFNLIPLLDQSLIVPRGLYNTSFFLAMNKNKWNRLTPAEQQAIDGIAGEAFARMAGQMWDRADAQGLAAMEDQIQVSMASEEQVNAMAIKLQPLVTEKLQEVAEAKINAQAAFNLLQTEIARVESELAEAAEANTDVE